MIKVVKYILIILSLVLSALLVINIVKYNNYKEINNTIIENTNNYKNQIDTNDNKSQNLNNDLQSLKEKNKDKIWEYERWIKWTEEIIEKTN